MKSDKRGRGKSAKPPTSQSASSSEVKSASGTSSGHVHSIGIQPEDVRLTRMLETLKPHDHLCLIYESQEEWRAAAAPFISIGLKQGEKCTYIVDTSTAEEIRKYLLEEGVDVASAEKSGQLSILHETEAYTREGSFDPDRMIALLISETEKAVSEGYPALRTTGEMTWVLRGYPGSERVLEYEAKLNRDFFPKYPCLAICQYDRWKFDPEIIKGIIMTHPLLVRGGRVYRNFYYIGPEEFLYERRAEREVQHWLNNVEREQRLWEELRANEQSFRAVTENANDGIVIAASDGTHLYANKRASEITGYGIEELLKIGMKGLAHPDEIPKLSERLKKRIAGEEIPRQYETAIVHKEGKVVPVEITASRGFWYGQIADIVIFRDITERKRVEQALQQSEERYRTLVEESFDGIFIQKGPKIIFASRRLSEMLGYDKSEIEGMDHWLLYHLDYQELTRERAKARMRGEEVPSQYEVKLQRKDGSTFDGEILARRIMFGDEPGIQVWVRDITERKRAEEVLRESEERFRNIAEATSEYIWETDAQARYSHATERIEAIFGRPLADIVGHKPFDFMPPEDKQEEFREICRRVMLGQTFSNLETIRRKKDGTRLNVSLSTAPILDAEGNVIDIMSGLVDITERKRSEEEKAVLQEQLRQSQKIEAIGRLSGGIAHDFNNILTVISGNTQLSLLDLKQGDPLRENIEEIRRASERAADLTRQLLAFSRKQMMEMKVLDMNHVVKGIDKMLHRLLGEDIDLVTVLPEGIGKVKADPGQIEQVIVNLAVNARDAMIEGGKLTIETADVELDEEYARKHMTVEPGRYVMLSVSDTGKGMTPEVKERIFEPFFTTKEMGKGTGLGLLPWPEFK